MSEHEQDQPAPQPEQQPQSEPQGGPELQGDPAHQGDPAPQETPQETPRPEAQPAAPQYAPPVEPSTQPEPQWIPVPPQHPYAAAPVAASGGRGLAIAAMALGLAALLTTAVAAAYSAGFVMIGAALGVVALALGVTALVKRQRPRAAGITGLTAGALAILLALGAGVFAIGSALLPIRSGDATGETPPPAETAPPEGDGSAIDWPANMATGGIIFGSTGGSIEPQRSAPLTQGTAPAVPEVTRDDGKNDVLLYVDYRCPYCMHFEEQNSALLEAAMQTGNTTVEVVPLTFLDRASNGSYYSSRAAGAVACLVDQQPELAWKAHVALLSSKLQPEEGISGPDNAQLISELEGAVGGLNAKAKDCITTERFVPFAQALSNWVFANTIPNAKDATLRVEGTPTALVNGVPYTGDPTDGAAFRAFFEEQTK